MGDNLVKGVQCYELFGGIALKIHTFSFSFHFSTRLAHVFNFGQPIYYIICCIYVYIHAVVYIAACSACLLNAVCLYNASFFAIYLCKCFLFSCFVLVY